ncbi:MAG: hypothetical protein A2504_09100 [Bdellovibrionales bacterium RIFOXYD12_FULL_39_22]|nr:MAG: hypothetical protein A2385_17450 [Bdellovibrionales bacterium RIFOXYB1_FULL_39_21]OFZ41102.1 MAG: hypothetical protein A2485_00375 [Bdellovibrionales bacterium RIFOXYC12_FULL_39_17]OFZ50315.1 MAG: hypothetical protein A2404_07690 [Bdellovibrionales bacterium RIFOXYC1_FULL_39_130]OFZ75116.1 MAG: hypothetical protein A2560_16385 [Bdellovibrionales bacterium RIFOXYD1_FULL_39_84]OFZ92242.1 MAG: hypothetical protein A2504_09100 [Bdellovibrionales bacterium RIFOXYD12_FULL_39_22]HLE10955.1 hy
MEKIVVYVGDDFRYWQNIQDFFKKKYEYLKYSFDSFFDPAAAPIELFFKLSGRCIDILYVDYSVNTVRHLELIRLLRMDNSTRHIVIVGLLGLDDRNISLRRAINAGVHFNHFKQVELDGLVYDALAVLCPEEVNEPKYARADLEFKIKAFHVANVNKILVGSVEFESDVALVDKDRCELRFAIPEKSLPYTGVSITIKKEFVVNPLRSNHYVAIWEYAPPLEELKNEAVTEKERREKEREERCVNIKRALATWLKTQQAYYITQKEIRVMVIDRRLEYKQKAMLADHNFVINVQSTLIDPEKEIIKYRPQLIFFVFDDEDKNEVLAQEAKQKAEAPWSHRNELRKKNRLPLIPRGSNDLKVFKEIVQTLKMNKIDAEIFSFNSSIDPIALKDSMNYEGYTPISAALSTEVVNKLGDNKFNISKKKRDQHVDKVIKSLKAKDPAKYLKVSKKTFQEDSIFISGEDSLYFGSLVDDIFLTGLSEVDVAISSRYPLEYYSVIRLDIPTTMYITLVPSKMRARTLRIVDKDYKYTYRGLIHSVDENQRKLLRRCVNAANTKEQENKDRLKQTMNIKEDAPIEVVSNADQVVANVDKIPKS